MSSFLIGRYGTATLAPVSGMWGWWDATVGVTGGATVTQWDDQSGNGRHLTPGAAGSPASGTRTLNGRNVIDFDGVNDGMGKTGAIGFGMTTYSVFFVGGEDATGGLAGMVTIYDSAAGHDYNTTNAMAFTGSLTSPARVAELDSNNASSIYAPGANVTPTAVWAVTKDSSHNIRIYKNGAEVRTDTVSAVGTANGGISVGWRAKEGANFWNGICGEVLVYTTTLLAADVTTNYTYLGAKWGL